MKRPDWLKTAVFYEIYPQSFMDSNGDGIGDFRGIISKLDYIAALGCNAIWMNPCFDSPFGDAGYDVRDYYKTAERYGSNDDLIELFAEVHKRNMHILLDLVPGHTSVEHKWFKESLKAEKNEFTDRYIWTDSVWKDIKGYGSLKGISDRDGVCAVNFFSHQPALNYGFYKPAETWQQPMDAPGPVATLNAMMDVMRFWLKAGADGFRVDMAGSLVKNDENGKGTIALWKKVRNFLDKEFPNAAMVSEWGEPDKSLQGGFHMDFLLHFGPSHYNDLFRCENPYFGKNGKGNIKDFVKYYKMIDSKRKTENEEGLICIPSGNHDMGRLSQCLATPEEQKLAFAFLLTMPGAPFIYYGDEIGMRYVNNLVSKEGGYGRTGSRSPMQWDNSKNFGFSNAEAEKLYIPQDSEKGAPDVKSAMEDKNSLWNEINKLIKLRLSVEQLGNTAEIKFIKTGSELVYKRFVKNHENEAVTVSLCPAKSSAKITDARGKIIYETGIQF